MADTNRHDAQVHRHEHTHVTQNLCMASRGSTWTLATTRAPPRRREPCPPGAGSAAGCCASAVIGRCVADVPWHKLRRIRAELGAWPLRHGLRIFSEYGDCWS
jgi:hypothetical protein